MQSLPQSSSRRLEGSGLSINVSSYEKGIAINTTTLRADVGSIGGHVAPSKALVDTVSRVIAEAHGDEWEADGAHGFVRPSFLGHVRTRAAEKALEIRRQGFSGPTMLSYSELEYGGIVKILERLEKRFTVRAATPEAEPALV